MEESRFFATKGSVKNSVEYNDNVAAFSIPRSSCIINMSQGTGNSLESYKSIFEHLHRICLRQDQHSGQTIIEFTIITTRLFIVRSPSWNYWPNSTFLSFAVPPYYHNVFCPTFAYFINWNFRWKGIDLSQLKIPKQKWKDS